MTVALIGMLVIIVLSFILVITVYGRLFRLYLYTAISPIPLAAFAGEPSQQIGISFLKSYSAVCLEGVVIALCCTIYSAYAAAPPDVDSEVPVLPRMSRPATSGKRALPRSTRIPTAAG